MDDFVYLCDDAYTSQEVRDMEADLLATLNYDINIPVAYQFLRRYAKVLMRHRAAHPTHLQQSTLVQCDVMVQGTSQSYRSLVTRCL